MPNVYEKKEVKERWYVCTCFIISLIEMNHNSFAYGFDKVRTICIEQHLWRWPNSRIQCNLPLSNAARRSLIYIGDGHGLAKGNSNKTDPDK